MTISNISKQLKRNICRHHLLFNQVVHRIKLIFKPNCRGLGQERKRRDLEYAGEDFNSELPPSLNRVLTMGPLMVAVNDVLIDPSRHGGLNAPEGKYEVLVKNMRIVNIK